MKLPGRFKKDSEPPIVTFDDCRPIPTPTPPRTVSVRVLIEEGGRLPEVTPRRVVVTPEDDRNEAVAAALYEIADRLMNRAEQQRETEERLLKLQKEFVFTPFDGPFVGHESDDDWDE